MRGSRPQCRRRRRVALVGVRRGARAVAESGLPAAGGPARLARPRQQRSGARRADPPRRGRASTASNSRSTGWSRRRAAWAAKAPASSRSSAIRRRNAARSTGRSTSSATRSSACRTQLEQLNGGTTERAAQRQSLLIALGNNGCGPQYRSAALARRSKAASSTACSAAATASFSRARRRRWAAPSAPSACAPATAIISRFRSRPRRTASATTSRPASACARRRRCSSTPITIPARK